MKKLFLYILSIIIVMTPTSILAGTVLNPSSGDLTNFKIENSVATGSIAGSFYTYSFWQDSGGKRWYKTNAFKVGLSSTNYFSSVGVPIPATSSSHTSTVNGEVSLFDDSGNSIWSSSNTPVTTVGYPGTAPSTGTPTTPPSSGTPSTGGTTPSTGTGALAGPNELSGLTKFFLKIVLIIAAAMVPVSIGDKLAGAISNKIGNATKGVKDTAWKTSGLGSYLEGKKRLKMEQGKDKALQRIGTTGLRNRFARTEAGSAMMNTKTGRALGLDKAYMTAERAKGQALMAHTKALEGVSKEAKMDYLRRFSKDGGQTFDKKAFEKDFQAQAMVASLSDAKLVNDNGEPQYNFLNEMRGHMVGMGDSNIIGSTKEAGGADYLTDSSLSQKWIAHTGMWISGQRHTPEQAVKMGTDNAAKLVQRYEDLTDGSAYGIARGKHADTDYTQTGENHEADISLGLAPGTGRYSMTIKGAAIADRGNYVVKDITTGNVVTRKLGDGQDANGWSYAGIAPQMQKTWNASTVENDLRSGGARVRNKVYSTPKFADYFLSPKVATKPDGTYTESARAKAKRLMDVAQVQGSISEPDYHDPNRQE